MSMRDIQLLYKIKAIISPFHFALLWVWRAGLASLGRVGTINLRENKNTALFRVRNKSHLKNIIIPIFDKYPLISNKQYDYLRFKNCLLENIKHAKDLPEYIRPIKPALNSSPVKIQQFSYFSAWLIGFIEAEGCFSLYKPTNDNSTVASFDISQTNSLVILQAIKQFLSLTSKICKDETDCYRIKVSSVRQIENVIKFMQKASIKLMGYKKLQYLLFLKGLRKIPRYTKKFNVPAKY